MIETDLKYIPNPKHKEPWQRGRKGALCPSWSHSIAQILLEESVEDPTSSHKARYATRCGLAFKAHPDGQGGWHGFPVGWNEVPDKIRNQWLKDKKIQRRDLRGYGFMQEDRTDNMVD
ncbi:MAG: hypothetical protein HQL80_00785 [Magnetococcales bacterium]|nr:hypothetical protein [Magnetococcales bacterium]